LDDINEEDNADDDDIKESLTPQEIELQKLDKLNKPNTQNMNQDQ